MEGTLICNACSHKRKWVYKNLAYTSSVRPILEYRSACWDPCRGQINVLDRVQKKAGQFTYHTKDSAWETLDKHRLPKTYYLSRLVHVRKITDRKSKNRYRAVILCK